MCWFNMPWCCFEGLNWKQDINRANNWLGTEEVQTMFWPGGDSIHWPDAYIRHQGPHLLTRIYIDIGMDN